MAPRASLGTRMTTHTPDQVRELVARMQRLAALETARMRRWSNGGKGFRQARIRHRTFDQAASALVSLVEEREAVNAAIDGVERAALHLAHDRVDKWERAEAAEAQIAALRTRVEEAERERDDARWFIAAEGYRRCDVPACNCGSWHGGHAMARLKEIANELDTNGRTILKAVQDEIAARAEAERKLAEAREEMGRLLDEREAIIKGRDDALVARMMEAAALRSRVERLEGLVREAYEAVDWTEFDCRIPTGEKLRAEVGG